MKIIPPYVISSPLVQEVEISNEIKFPQELKFNTVYKIDVMKRLGVPGDTNVSSQFQLELKWATIAKENDSIVMELSATQDIIFTYQDLSISKRRLEEAVNVAFMMYSMEFDYLTPASPLEQISLPVATLLESQTLQALSEMESSLNPGKYN